MKGSWCGMKSPRWVGWLIFILNREDMTVSLTLVFPLNFLFNVMLTHSFPCIMKLRNCIAGSWKPMAIRKTLLPTNYKLEALWLWRFHKSLLFALPRSSALWEKKKVQADRKSQCFPGVLLSSTQHRLRQLLSRTTAALHPVFTSFPRGNPFKAYRQKKTLEIHSLGLHP